MVVRSITVLGFHIEMGDFVEGADGVNVNGPATEALKALYTYRKWQRKEDESAEVLFWEGFDGNGPFFRLDVGMVAGALLIENYEYLQMTGSVALYEVEERLKQVTALRAALKMEDREIRIHTSTCKNA